MDVADLKLPQVFLARHGETGWTITGQHTGLTDLPLTQRGERNARRLRQRLHGTDFVLVMTSPLQRAARTCDLAGLGGLAVVDDDLVEWNYGDYEGKTPAQIRRQRPDWELFRDGCPHGESVADVAARARRVIQRLRTLDGHAMLFSHSHFLHVFAACWLSLEPAAGRHFYLGTAALSIVGYHQSRDDSVIRLWNDCSHEETEESEN